MLIRYRQGLKYRIFRIFLELLVYFLAGLSLGVDDVDEGFRYRPRVCLYGLRWDAMGWGKGWMERLDEYQTRGNQMGLRKKKDGGWNAEKREHERYERRDGWGKMNSFFFWRTRGLIEGLL